MRPTFLQPTNLAMAIALTFIRFQKNHYTALFADKKLALRFFNSKTHPLGLSRHSVPVEA